METSVGSEMGQLSSWELNWGSKKNGVFVPELPRPAVVTVVFGSNLETLAVCNKRP